MTKVLKILITWRLLLFIPVILSQYVLDYGTSVPFFEITFYKDLPKYLDHPFLTAWANFDGVHYLNIASDGYESAGRFFPFFPLIIFLLSFGNLNFPITFIVSLIIPNLIFIAALFVFLKLLRLDYSEKTSWQTFVYLLIFPTSFFFISVYSEGIFLLLILLSFYFMRTKKWYIAAIMAMLLSGTRLVGLVIVPALIFEYIITEKPRNPSSFIKLILLSLISSLGLIAYSTYSYFHWGDFLHFLNAQGELNNGRSTSALIFPLQTVYRYFKILTTLPLSLFEWWIALLELLSFIYGTFFLFLAWRKKVRTSYLVFGVLAFLIPSLSGTFSGLPRYLIVIFPIFIAMAQIKSSKFRISYYLISASLLFLLLMYFTMAYYIS